MVAVGLSDVWRRGALMVPRCLDDSLGLGFSWVGLIFWARLYMCFHCFIQLCWPMGVCFIVIFGHFRPTGGSGFCHVFFQLLVGILFALIKCFLLPIKKKNITPHFRL